MFRRLIWVSILVFGGLLGLGVFGYRSIRMHEQGLEGRRMGEFTAVAEQIRSEVKRSLNGFLAAEQIRPFTDYQYVYTPQAANDLNAIVRSPLGDELSHGLAYGYFQINPDSTITTPHALEDSAGQSNPTVRNYLSELRGPLLARLGESGKPLASLVDIKANQDTPVPQLDNTLTAEEELKKTADALMADKQAIAQTQSPSKGKMGQDRAGTYRIEPDQQKTFTEIRSRGNVEQNIFNNALELRQQLSDPPGDPSYMYQQSQQPTPQFRQQGQTSSRRDSSIPNPPQQTIPPQPIVPQMQSQREQTMQPAGQAPTVPHPPQESQRTQTATDYVQLQIQQQGKDVPQVGMQQSDETQQQQIPIPQFESLGQQQARQDLVQIRIEPFMPVWVSEPKAGLAFGGQVYFLRHVQIEQKHITQGFRLDQQKLLGLVEDAARRLLRRGMGYKLGNGVSPDAVHTAILDFGFGDLALNLLELDPGWIARDIGVLRKVYVGIWGIVVGATGAAIFGLGKGLAEQLRLSRKKDDFISAVSHELRTPLTTIRMYTEMLEKDWVRTESKRNEYYSIMRQESERLTRLIENVLDFSRIQRGRKQYDFKIGDLNRIVGDIVEMMTPCAQRAGFTIVQDLNEIEPFCFDADAVMQIVINLVDNAIKYAHNADDKTIFIRTRADGRQAMIEVEDRGPGVPRTEREKIFEEFYRIGDESRRETTGTGLGLALVKRFAEAHHGAVAVMAANPCGALFRVGLAVKV